MPLCPERSPASALAVLVRQKVQKTAYRFPKVTRRQKRARAGGSPLLPPPGLLLGPTFSLLSVPTLRSALGLLAPLTLRGGALGPTRRGRDGRGLWLRPVAYAPRPSGLHGPKVVSLRVSREAPRDSILAKLAGLVGVAVILSLVRALLRPMHARRRGCVVELSIVEARRCARACQPEAEFERVAA